MPSPNTQAIIQKFIENYPLHQLYRFCYRFFAGGRNYYPDWIHGEKTEPGFTIGALSSLIDEFYHLDTPLTLSVIDNIHLKNITGVLNTNYTAEEFEEGKTSYRSPGHHVQFGLIPGSNLSKAGLSELKATTQITPYAYDLRKITNKNISYYALVCLSDQAKQDTQDILEQYENEMPSIVGDYTNVSEDKIITRIVQLSVELERLHPYGDGNCRTFGIVLLNRELVRHGLSPTFIDDPNQLDGYAIEELVQKVKEGQSRYQEILENDFMNTPFRSGVALIPNVDDELPPKAMLIHSVLTDFTDLEDANIYDMPEYQEGRPYQGETENNTTRFVHRLIVESMINKLLHSNISEQAAILKQRLGTFESEDIFYTKDLFQTLQSFSPEEKNTVIKAALHFGANKIIKLIEMLPEEDAVLLDVQKNNVDKPLDLSPIGYCLKIDRLDFVETMMTSFSSDKFLYFLKHDLKTLCMDKDKAHICDLARLIDKHQLWENIPNESSEYLLLKLAYAANKLHLQPSPSGIFSVFKTNPSQDADAFLTAGLSRFSADNEDQYQAWFQRGLKKCTQPVKNLLVNEKNKL